MRNAFIDTILESCLTRDDVFVLSGDAGLGVFDRFREERPDRFLNMGVAEQNTISFAAGLAMTGYRVLVYNIIPFVLYRCFEQVRNDICYQELPVILAGIGSGVTYAPMGMTHYSVEDIGVARTLPNLEVISPIDPVEARLAAEYALQADRPVYVRLAKRGEPDIHANRNFDLRTPQLLKDGKSCAILFHGSVGTEVFLAAEMLQQHGVCPRIISVPFLQPLDMQRLLEMLGDVKHVFTVEEHFTGSGLGSMLAVEFARISAGYRLHMLGISDGYIHDVLDNDGMRDSFGISAGRIATRVANTVG